MIETIKTVIHKGMAGLIIIIPETTTTKTITKTTTITTVTTKTIKGQEITELTIETTIIATRNREELITITEAIQEVHPDPVAAIIEVVVQEVLQVQVAAITEAVQVVHPDQAEVAPEVVLPVQVEVVQEEGQVVQVIENRIV